MLDRIAQRNGELNAYLHVDGERALAEVERADVGVPLGGIPVCVKDVVDVAGMPTRAGAAGWERRPQADAPVVARCAGRGR